MIEQLEVVLQAARSLKESVVAKEGKTDVLPLLDLWGTSTSFLCPISQVTMNDAPKAISAAIGAARPFLALLVTDTYWVGGLAAQATMAGDYQRGDLGARFKAGDPAVHEALVVLGCTGSHVEGHVLPYVYEGPRPWTVRWLPPEELPLVYTDGRIVDSMIRGFDLVAANADPGAQLLVLKELGGLLMSREEVAFTGTRRNEPCPCGSGRKYKHCHGM